MIPNPYFVKYFFCTISAINTMMIFKFIVYHTIMYQIEAYFSKVSFQCNFESWFKQQLSYSLLYYIGLLLYWSSVN